MRSQDGDSSVTIKKPLVNETKKKDLIPSKKLRI